MRNFKARKMFLHFGILLLLSQGLLGEGDISEAIDGDSRIIGGKDATPGMANYQVSIRDHTGYREWHGCGGSIINEEYVLTAAHCIFEKNIEDMSIVVGSHTINKGGDRYKIKKFILHANYSEQVLKNDIALIQIEGKFKFSDKVQPIELLKEMAPIGKKCLFTGWGYDSLGDSGGPLVMQDEKNKTVQIGVVSWVVPCAKNFPDVFASVHGYYDWIQGKIK